MEKTCVDCQRTATNKWYAGPICSYCYEQKRTKRYADQIGNCKGCSVTKSIKWYYEGTQCSNCYRKARYDANPQKYRDIRKAFATKNPEKNHGYLTKGKYGIDHIGYAELLKEQNGVCKICKELSKNKKRLAVDHCHVTGKVRGLLCDCCNRALGLLKDSTDVLLAAADYLKKAA